MKYRVALLAASIVALSSCGFRNRMDHLDAGRKNADSIMDLMDNDAVLKMFPEKYFKPNQISTIIQPLRESCDWQKRRGKFVDFYMLNNGEEHDLAYIYEYFLDCDSLRFVLVYNTDGTKPELYSMKIEPLETENPLLVDPRKSILKDDKWDKK